MLHSMKEMKGLAIAATDGELGTIAELYFDDAQWTIRYLVVDTGGWITGRTVLIPINALLATEWADEVVRVNLTRQQIEDSPGIEADKPVVRQHESALYSHYGYPYYWAGPFAWGYTAYPTVVADRASDYADSERMKEQREQADPHLRSSKEVTGYDIRATDDSVGHVEDFLFDDRDWSIQLMVVDTRNWWPGKSVLISPNRIDHASWEDRQIAVSITRDEVEDSPEYDSAYPPPIGPKYDLYRRFGMPHS